MSDVDDQTIHPIDRSSTTPALLERIRYVVATSSFAMTGQFLELALGKTDHFESFDRSKQFPDILQASLHLIQVRKGSKYGTRHIQLAVDPLFCQGRLERG